MTFSQAPNCGNREKQCEIFWHIAKCGAHKSLAIWKCCSEEINAVAIFTRQIQSIFSFDSDIDLKQSSRKRNHHFSNQSNNWNKLFGKVEETRELCLKWFFSISSWIINFWHSVFPLKSQIYFCSPRSQLFTSRPIVFL